MACETVLRPRQTVEERAEEVRQTVARISAALVAGRVKAIVGPQGAVSFIGDEERNGVVDACVYRRIMVSGSALAKAKIAQAEQLSGRSISRSAVNLGIHSHDGKTWGRH